MNRKSFQIITIFTANFIGFIMTIHILIPLYLADAFQNTNLGTVLFICYLLVNLLLTTLMVQSVYDNSLKQLTNYPK